MLLFLRFSPEFDVPTFSRWLIREPNFFGELSKKIFLQNVHFGPIRWVPRRFSKFQFFIVEIFHFNLIFLGNFRNLYSMHMLSIRGNDFIAHWAYSETVSSHTEHTRNQFNATNCLESRKGHKEQRLKIGEREQETRNREVRLGREDRRQGKKKLDMEQRAEDKEQRS